jgi:ribosomal subunit interface protein
MQLTVTGKQVDVGDALRFHVETTLESLLGKYFRTAIEAHTVFAREAHLIAVDLSLHVGRGIVVNSRGTATDHYIAFDTAAERLAKQLRRYKRRLRDYHGKTRPVGERPEMARSFVLAPVEDAPGEDIDEEADAAAEIGDATEAAADGGIAPVVIAEMSTELPRLTVGEAVMRMDLADAPMLLFRNRSHGELNVVYRRGDGNVGWIDPANSPPANSPGNRAGNRIGDTGRR